MSWANRTGCVTTPTTMSFGVLPKSAQNERYVGPALASAG